MEGELGFLPGLIVGLIVFALPVAMIFTRTEEMKQTETGRKAGGCVLGLLLLGTLAVLAFVLLALPPDWSVTLW